MCHHSYYIKRLAHSGLSATANRIKILEIIASAGSPLSAQQIYEITSRSQSVNRVTVYRFLDLLVEKNLIDKMSSGERTLFYAPPAPDSRPLQPHFYCSRCGSVECIDARKLEWHLKTLERSFPGRIDKIEIRLEGVCRNCLNHDRKKIRPPASDIV